MGTIHIMNLLTFPVLFCFAMVYPFSVNSQALGQSYFWVLVHQIESMKTTSMETVSRGVLDKNKKHDLISIHKAEKSYDVLRHIQLHMSKYKNEDLQSIMSHLQPNSCLKIDIQKVDTHTGGKWLIHHTKRRKDNQLQSLKLPCRISSWVARFDIKGSDGAMLNPILWKKVPGAKTSWEVRGCRTPNT